MPDSWDAFASREPYFAVLSQPQFLRARFDAAAEAEFFATGEAYVADLYGRILDNVAQNFTPLTVLEYGCGVGRLAIPFARRAERVTAVDGSRAMLTTAARHVEASGLRNVELLHTDDFARDPRTFDLVNCHLVLQRLRRRPGLALIRALTGRVREGGMLVLQLPYRSRASLTTRTARRARTRVPGLNAVANLVRGKSASTPAIETNAYDLNEVFAILQQKSFDEPHLAFDRSGDMDVVVIHARRRHQPGSAATESKPGTTPLANPDFIDVKAMIANTSIDELNAIAERYFSSLESWEHHLAKPFARVEDTPQLLISLGSLLQGLHLAPGMTVLEFGAGTGWLSKFLTQLGCRMILVDVSPTALRIAQELYARQPVLGDRPQPRFLVYDGRRIDLEDASVDRILCFDSFHHSPNPEDVLREFGRVLRPRGIAGFAEPGPKHSKTPQSQYEMRTYGVVENDIDIHEIWTLARRYGFYDIRLAAHNVPPFHVSLAEYDDLLAAGETYGRWAESTRGYLQDVRMFFLAKAGIGELDSRKPEGLQCVIEAQLSPELVGHIRVKNTGRARWLASSENFGGVSLGIHRYDENGVLADLEYARFPLPKPLAPGEETTFEVQLPALPAGTHILELDCVANHVAWFAQTGSKITRVTARSPGS
jgi:SAM-dependent methyltransferase